MNRYTATLWRNMHIALPYEIVEKLDLRPGEKFAFVDCGDKVIVEKEDLLARRHA